MKKPSKLLLMVIIVLFILSSNYTYSRLKMVKSVSVALETKEYNDLVLWTTTKVAENEYTIYLENPNGYEVTFECVDHSEANFETTCDATSFGAWERKNVSVNLGIGDSTDLSKVTQNVDGTYTTQVEIRLKTPYSDLPTNERSYSALSSDMSVTTGAIQENPNYKDSVYGIFADSWGNTLSGYDNYNITTFDKTSGTLMFANSTFNVPSEYTITHVYVYDANDTWINTPLATYIRNDLESKDDGINHERPSDFVFNRNNVTDLSEALTTDNGNLRFLVMVSSSSSS